MEQEQDQSCWWNSCGGVEERGKGGEQGGGKELQVQVKKEEEEVEYVEKENVEKKGLRIEIKRKKWWNSQEDGN